MNRRQETGARRWLRDTLVIGLVTLTIVGIALVISYQAQNGLPWVPTYDIHADVTDGSKLLKNADVRIGGARVGQVLKITAMPGDENHPPFARLDLALNSDVGPLPADSTVEVRLASVLGGKFLDLVPGKRGEGVKTIPAGGVLPLAQSRPGIDTDVALRVFGPEVREAIRETLGELGTGFAGRGVQLNQTIEDGARLFPAAERVLRTLAAKNTDLGGFLQGAASAAEAIAPLSDQLAQVMDDTATTFDALDAAGGSLDDLLSGLPPAEEAATRAFGAVQPVLDDATALVVALRPAGAILEDSLTKVNSAMRKAAPVATRTGTLTEPLRQALVAVNGFAGDPSSTGAITALKGEDLATFGGSAFIGLGAILKTTADAQLHCNAVALWMRNLVGISNENDSHGGWLRTVPVVAPSQNNHAAQPSADLHVNFYPHENATECESGNETYTDGQLIGNPPGKQPTTVEITGQEAP
jgi:virulence factor Mce-like protein